MSFFYSIDLDITFVYLASSILRKMLFCTLLLYYKQVKGLGADCAVLHVLALQSKCIVRIAFFFSHHRKCYLPRQQEDIGNLAFFFFFGIWQSSIFMEVLLLFDFTNRL
jgi:hypothetical protein